MPELNDAIKQLQTQIAGMGHAPTRRFLEQKLSQLMQYQGEANQYSDMQSQIEGRYKDITDFNSPFYAQYRKYLQLAMPKMGTNAMLAPLMAGNMDYGTAQKLGSMRATEMNAQTNEAVNNGVMGFGLEMQSQANPLLNLKSNNFFGMQNLWENRNQFNQEMEQRRSENRGGFFNQILGLGGGLASMFLSGGGSNSPYGGNSWEGAGKKWNPFTKKYF